MNKSSAIKQFKKLQPTVIIGFYFFHQKDGLRYFAGALTALNNMSNHYCPKTDFK